MPRLPLLAITAVLLAAAPGSAQFLGSNGGVGQDTLSGLLGGKSGGGTELMDGLLPDVGATSKGNAAGLLSYCVRNRLLGQGSGAMAALGALTGGGKVAQSKGFAAGQSGQLVSGRGPSLSLDSLRGKVKARVCDMVLGHAKAMAGL